jgi:gluconate 2-dehydrogenase gamma chain
MKTITSDHLLPPFKSGLTRRDFLKQSSIITLFAGLAVYKPTIAKPAKSAKVTKAAEDSLTQLESFTDTQKQTLQAVQWHLFPDDGDGPSAKDINALKYLQWALKDPENQADGDGEFIIKGLDSLQHQSKKSHGKYFLALNQQQQYQQLKQIEQTKLGENWLSLLIYYLIEALLLDPVYGGNPNGIGWKWLGHPAGYPRPTQGHTYLDYSADYTNNASLKA